MIQELISDTKTLVMVLGLEAKLKEAGIITTIFTLQIKLSLTPMDTELLLQV